MPIESMMQGAQSELGCTNAIRVSSRDAGQKRLHEATSKIEEAQPISQVDLIAGHSSYLGSVQLERTMHKSPTSTLAIDLPQEVSEAANLREQHRIVAWTKLDPQLEDRVEGQACVTVFGPMLVLPCFWPHMLVIMPCLCWGRASMANAIRSQYWILTERELKVITLDYPMCFGLATSGTQVKSIPLENITDCGVDAVGKGILNSCFDPMPSIYVDTASSGSRRREATGTALADYRSFMQKILDQRDIVKGTSSPGAVVVAEPMERGDKGSVADRMMQAKELFDAGLISESEYEKKRQEIFAGV